MSGASCQLSTLLEMSQTCPGHVLRMGTYCKISVIGWVMHLQHVLAVSHVSSLSPGTKNLQIIQIFQINLWKLSSIPLSKISYSNSIFGISRPILIPKLKNEVSVKEKITNTKNELQCISRLPPPCDTLILSNIRFFHFSFDPFAPCCRKIDLKWLMMSALTLFHP